MTTEKPSSVLSKIQAAAEDYKSATKARFQALGALYRIYRQLDGNGMMKAEINLAFVDLQSSARPKKVKSDAGKIAWLAFPHSQQRVSDAKKLMEYARDKGVVPDDFAEWLNNLGGIRATLLSLVKSKKSGEATNKSLSQKLNSVFGSLWEAASSRRIEHENPTQCTLKEGQKHVQITEYKNGEYTVVDAVLSGSEIEFGTSSQPTKPVSSIAEMAQQAKAAQDVSAPKMDAA